MRTKLKVLASAGIAAVAAGGAAVAAALPDAAGNGLDTAEERTGIELPASHDDHPTGDDHPGGAPEETVTVEADDTGDDGATTAGDTPDAATFGQTVSDAAQSGEPQEDGAAFGEWVSTMAQEEHRPDTPAGEEHRADAADDNPGVEHRP